MRFGHLEHSGCLPPHNGHLSSGATVSTNDDSSGAPSLGVAEIADKAGLAAWGSSWSDWLETESISSTSSWASFALVAEIASLSVSVGVISAIGL